MLCDICGKNPATVHLTEIIDDQMKELHLCEECAHEKSAAMEQQFVLSDLLAGLSEFGKSSKDQELISVKCPNCQLTYADFKKLGRLGCAECYNVFRKYLTPLLRKIHGSSQHIGKSPLKVRPVRNSAAKKKDPLAEARSKLAQAIEKEEFEEAAKLRDQIKLLEVKANNQEAEK